VKGEIVKMSRYIWKTAAHLDVDEVCNEGHEDHLLSIPTLLGVCFDLPLQFPTLSAVSHENLPGIERARQQERETFKKWQKYEKATNTSSLTVFVNRASFQYSVLYSFKKMNWDRWGSEGKTLLGEL